MAWYYNYKRTSKLALNIYFFSKPMSCKESV